MSLKNITIPLDVPQAKHSEFIENFNAITKDTANLFLYACDQKIEHLNKEFYGKDIPKEVNDAERLFKIASAGKVGAMATQLGLIARYGQNFDNINYIVKLNSKTNIIPSSERDPISTELWSVDNIIKFKKESNLPIRGVGYTVYLGSEFEHIMLNQASQIINQAHEHGLITILWMYPRSSKYIKSETDGNLIAGAAGVANCLGADFAKVKAPESDNENSSEEYLKIITQAAGNTKVICAGGKLIDDKKFLEEIFNEINIGRTSGCAVGRNIFKRPFDHAIRLSKAISAIVYEKASLEKALAIIK